MFHGRSQRRRIAGIRTFRLANARTGAAMSRSQMSGGIGALTGHGARVASIAAMMLPPDTDETVSSLASTPVSFSRRSAPR